MHLTGSRAAAAAGRAGGVGRLVLTHIPAWNDPEVCRAQAAAVWGARVELARSGWTTEIGAPSGEADLLDRAAARRMWGEYAATVPDLVDQEMPVVEWFGDSPELADELLAFVLSGTKRATAGLVAEYAAEQEPLPRVGDHWVVCDGSGAPRAVLRAVELPGRAAVQRRRAVRLGRGRVRTHARVVAAPPPCVLAPFLRPHRGRVLRRPRGLLRAVPRGVAPGARRRLTGRRDPRSGPWLACSP